MFNNSKSSSKGPISRDRKVRSREPLLSDDRKSVQGFKKSFDRVTFVLNGNLVRLLLQY